MFPPLQGYESTNVMHATYENIAQVFPYVLATTRFQQLYQTMVSFLKDTPRAPETGPLVLHHLRRMFHARGIIPAEATDEIVYALMETALTIEPELPRLVLRASNPDDPRCTSVFIPFADVDIWTLSATEVHRRLAVVFDTITAA